MTSLSFLALLTGPKTLAIAKYARFMLALYILGGQFAVFVFAVRVELLGIGSDQYRNWRRHGFVQCVGGFVRDLFLRVIAWPYFLQRWLRT